MAVTTVITVTVTAEVFTVTNRPTIQKQVGQAGRHTHIHHGPRSILIWSLGRHIHIHHGRIHPDLGRHHTQVHRDGQDRRIHLDLDLHHRQRQYPIENNSIGFLPVDRDKNRQRKYSQETLLLLLQQQQEQP